MHLRVGRLTEMVDMVSLFISRLPGNLRLAKSFEGKLERFSWEMESPAYPLGTIYRGFVTHVLPGGQGAFLDLGKGQQGFLNRAGVLFPKSSGRKTKLGDLIKQGQTHLVQLQKPAVDEKQPLVSKLLRFQGYFLIHLPMEKGIFFSKKLEADREPIRALFSGDRHGGGWIVRSAASEVPLSWLQKEKEILQALAGKILSQSEGCAENLWKPDPIESWLQDQAFPLPKRVLVDDELTYAELKNHLHDRHPGLLPVLSFHDPTHPMFLAYRLQSQLDKALASKVWLPSGGFLIFQQTEALVSIDVNSGKQKKGKTLSSSALRTNLEAVEEISRQLRLRNLAGLIVIDFIDMPEPSDRQVLDAACQKKFTQDEVSVDVLPLNRFGLVCLTRERYGMDLMRQTLRSCHCCRGEGLLEKDHLLGVRIQTEILSDGASYRGERLNLQVHPEALDFFQKHRDLLFGEMEQKGGFSLCLTGASELTRNSYRIGVWEKTEEERKQKEN